MRATKSLRAWFAAYVAFSLGVGCLCLRLMTRGHSREDRAARDVDAIARVTALSWKRNGAPTERIDALVSEAWLERFDDPWGRPYRLTRRDGSVLVSSAGRDGDFGTGDDVSGEVPRPR